jgi:hypothetical protein
MKISRQCTILRRTVVLRDFMDPDLSLDNEGLMKLKRNEESTSYLRSKFSAKELHSELRKNGWHINRSTFSAEYDSEKPQFWKLMKAADPKGKHVSMRSSVNRDPSTIMGPSNATFRTSFPLEEDGQTFVAPPPLPEGHVECSTLHSSSPALDIEEDWQWAFDSPKKK